MQTTPAAGSAITSTAAIIFFMVGVPVLLVDRLSNGVLPTRSFDIVLVGCLAGWVFICRAVIERNEPLESLTQQRISPRWQASNLVAQSIVGVGFVPRATSAPAEPLLRLATPHASVDALLPPPAAAPESGRVRRDPAEDGPRKAIPTLRADEPADSSLFTRDNPSIEDLDTEEYVIARGDTFWSLADYVFDDGRLWKSIQALNLGREVAPGVFLTESDEPRIGWSVLIPVLPTSNEGEDNVAPQ